MPLRINRNARRPDSTLFSSRIASAAVLTGSRLTVVIRSSGRTPPALCAVLTEWPLVSAPMAEALIGAILELSRLTETPAPSINAVYACVKLLNKVMLLEGGGVRVSDAA